MKDTQTTKKTDTHIQKITEFLGLFNILDKHLDKLIGQDTFMPFNEKIKVIKQSSLPISTYISRHAQRLKFIGEIRNHISHGLQYDEHQYILPSHDLIQLLHTYIKHIRNPSPLSSYITPLQAYLTHQSSRKQTSTMLQKHKHIPVYHAKNKEFLGVISTAYIGKRCIYNPHKLIPEQIIDIIESTHKHMSYVNMHVENSVHELFTISSKIYNTHQHIDGIIIRQKTDNKKKEPEIYTIIDPDQIPGLRSRYEPSL